MYDIFKNGKVADDYFTRLNKLPDVLWFKDPEYGQNMMRRLAKIYGEGNIPKHFYDDLAMLETEAKKYPYSYTLYKDYIMKKNSADQ